MRRLDNSDDPNVLSKLAPCAKKSKEKRKLLRLRRVREGHLKWRVPKPMPRKAWKSRLAVFLVM